MSKLIRIVAAGSAVTSRLLGAAASARRRLAPMVLVALLGTLLAVGCAPERPPRPPAGEVIVAAGDIADCSLEGDGATARLVEGIDGATVLTLGDHAYPDGTAEEFVGCYDPTWGQFKERTKPSPGNHDYETEGASAYFEYFGKAAGDPDEGYYSYELGEWHIVALNSNCGEGEVRCGPRSAQTAWLEEDLAANADEGRCTLAYMHHPRFSSGVKHGSTANMEPLWEALYEGGAEVVLSAHEHNYERFAPQDPEGRADPEGGIREFVVGTGGKGLYPILDPLANSEVHNDETHGVLKLTLRPKGYEWRFVPPVESAEEFTDSGSDQCH
jgi:calcineurin-like phosphoesterase family protein